MLTKAKNTFEDRFIVDMGDTKVLSSMKWKDTGALTSSLLSPEIPRGGVGVIQQSNLCAARKGAE